MEHGAGPAASELELKGLAKELSGLDCKHAVCPIHISHISRLWERYVSQSNYGLSATDTPGLRAISTAPICI